MTIRKAVGLGLTVIVLLPTAAASGASLTCRGEEVTITGTLGPDVLRGTAGPDVIHGRGGDDTIRSKGGDDLVCGGAGNDTILGGPGNDHLHGGTGSDLLKGWTGADRLSGHGESDRLLGGPGDDRIRGGGGNDTLDGQGGDDRLLGGAGTDYCTGETVTGCEDGGAATGDVLYVAPDGSNQADGMTQATAFATIKRALNVVKPGGEVRILPGTYSQRILVEQVGGPAGEVTVTGWQGRPVLDGERQRTLGIFCEQCQNVIFENLEITGFTDIGIGATLSEGITFRDLVVHDNGAAVELVGWELEGYGIHVDDSAGITIEDNEVYRNGPDPPVFPDRLLGTGINTFGLTGATIRNNRSHDNHGGGILVEDSRDVLVEGNEVFGNDLDAWDADEWWDGGLWLDGGRNVTVRNNHFHDNLGPGIEISDEDNQDPTGYVLENNISTGNYYGIYVWGFGTNGWPAPSIISRGGNDFSGNLRQDVWIQPDA